MLKLAERQAVWPAKPIESPEEFRDALERATHRNCGQNSPRARERALRMPAPRGLLGRWRRPDRFLSEPCQRRGLVQRRVDAALI